MAGTTSNVAGTSLSGVAGGYPTALTPKAFPDWLSGIEQAATPLIAGISKGKANERNSYGGLLTWGNDWNRPRFDQLAEADDGSETALDVDNPSYFAVYDIIKIGDELMRVTAIAGSTLTVQRAQGGTSSVVHADNDTIQILGPAYLQNQDTQLTPITQGETFYNEYQQFEFMLQSSHKREVFDSFETMGKGGAIKHFAKKLMEIEAPLLLESTLIHGLRQAETASAAPLLGGVLQPAWTENRDSVSGALTLNHIMDALRDTWKRSDKGVDLDVMCGPLLCSVISSFFSGMRRTTGDADTVRTHYEKIITPYGTIRLTPNPNWVKPGANSVANELDVVLIANLKDFELTPAPDAPGDPSVWTLGYDAPPTTAGWYKKCYLRGMYSLKAANPLKRTVLYGMSTTRSDYPNAL